MSIRWKIGSHTFTINPNTYGERISILGDNVKTLDGTLISQPTSTQDDYHLSSVFFERRPKVLSEVSIGSGNSIEHMNNKFYILNNTLAKVDVYSGNLSTLEKSIAVIDVPSGESLVVFDVQSNETLWVVQDLTPNDNIHKISGVTKTIFPTSGISGNITGIKYFSSHLWVSTSSSKLYKLNPSNMDIVSSITLPSITPASYGYGGMTSLGASLVITYSDSQTSGVYFIDASNGNISNNFYFQDYRELKDVAYDGSHYIFLINNENTIRYTTGNTVLLDIYELEKEIKSSGFLNMVDDMGVSERVSISDYSISRDQGSLQRYSVDISASKVDRGVV